MTTFGLVHGAYHGAWCWTPLVEELRVRGHDAIAVELPCDQPGGAEEYAAACVAAFSDAGPGLVVVGHSLAGLVIPLVAQRRPVAQLVYLCSLLPRPGQTQDDVMAAEPDMILPWPAGGAYVDADGAVAWHPDPAAAYFFADCDPSTAHGAAVRLRRQFWTVTQEVTPLTSWPDVPVTALIGSHDAVVNPVWSRRVVPELLGMEPLELNAGHAPFLSAPSLLADALEALA